MMKSNDKVIRKSIKVLDNNIYSYSTEHNIFHLMPDVARQISLK